jgi:hypothetical protein
MGGARLKLRVWKSSRDFSLKWDEYGEGVAERGWGLLIFHRPVGIGLEREFCLFQSLYSKQRDN